MLHRIFRRVVRSKGKESAQRAGAFSYFMRIKTHALLAVKNNSGSGG